VSSASLSLTSYKPTRKNPRRKGRERKRIGFVKIHSEGREGREKQKGEEKGEKERCRPPDLTQRIRKEEKSKKGEGSFYTPVTREKKEKKGIEKKR